MDDSALLARHPTISLDSNERSSYARGSEHPGPEQVARMAPQRRVDSRHLQEIGYRSAMIGSRFFNACGSRTGVASRAGERVRSLARSSSVWHRMCRERRRRAGRSAHDVRDWKPTPATSKKTATVQQ